MAHQWAETLRKESYDRQKNSEQKGTHQKNLVTWKQKYDIREKIQRKKSVGMQKNWLQVKDSTVTWRYFLLIFL